MEPNTPQNLEELVENTDLPILTMSSLFVSSATSDSDWILTTQVIPNLIADSKNHSRKQKTYSNLLNDVILASDFIFNVAKNISATDTIWNSNGTQVVLEKQGIFSLIDHSDYLKLFHHSLALFGKYKPAKAHNAMNLYTLRNVWHVQKNFFANIFLTGLISLVESGIYERWEKNGNIQRIYLDSYFAFRGINNESYKINGEDTEATTLGQVRVPFVLYLGMSLASLVVFLIEYKF